MLDPDDLDSSLIDNEQIFDAQQLLHSLQNSISNTNSAEYISTVSPFSSGEMITDRYQIIDVISRGSMGVVYRATDLKFNRVVAIKFSLPDKPLNDKSKERFERETRVVGLLQHQNIVSVHDSGVLPNGMLYLVMEHIDGQTLTDLLKNGKKLDIDTAVPIFMQICKALNHAHGRDVIHRDLKPSNIMLVNDNDDPDKLLAKVIDFSISKFTRPKPDQKTISRPGDVFGSPLYMSPEQCQAKELDQRSDIYSLGCIMYEAFCGAPPIIGNNAMATIYMHVHNWPTRPSKIIKNPPLPVYLEAIIVRCLNKDPSLRFQSAKELLDELECFYNGDKKKRSGWLNQLAELMHRREGAPS